MAILPPKGKILHWCHSCGATHVKNALLNSPENVRQRIIVIAIAPAEIILKNLCHTSYNYMSSRDFVTRTDVKGWFLYREELNILTPHAKAPVFDHGFDSPTFEERIKYHTNKYINECKGKK